ncbi:MoaD/ThiS family protein [Blastopirellula sp. JC732]|uniref:MoaD/ThiS family protein n=1 Tax=Blastopirellula sediminis TaxID=2894196 RepID=A0A9X1MV54_9BACT|nr:MoaD/ThiS family protein [Blastopirellula sediminis]MCC9604507.1 MoaD/ThiS family protein [Blastopirellula sediminis]MCC9632194.1 MoaD/ThiS family protein [Blastopirellula sediminis]
MLEIEFTSHLRRLVDLPDSVEVDAPTVAAALDQLAMIAPAIDSYLRHEDGSLRRHVNIFLDDQFVRDRQRLSDSTAGVTRLFIMQALSGG